MFFVALAWGSALAQSAPDAAEEVLVWGDPFLRWEQRWYVETEINYPTPFQLPGYVSQEEWVTVLQVRAVLACRKDGGGPQRIEARCEIEDLALVGRPRRGFDATPEGSALLRELDATLTGAEVQLQAGHRGTVPNLDLEGLTGEDQRARARAEMLRQVLARVVVPFHLRLPKTVRPGARWFDQRSQIFTMPSSKQASVGAGTVAHYLDPYQGRLLVQSIGRAQVKLPGKIARSTDTFGMITEREQGALRFALDLDSVAVFDPDTGIMVERVWSVMGRSTGSSAVTRDAHYHHVGQLRLLGEHDRPDVGATKMVGRAEWVAWTPP